MKKQEIENGYELIADDEKDLVIIVKGEEIARTKQVTIPSGETLNKWVEVPERVSEEVKEEQGSEN